MKFPTSEQVTEDISFTEATLDDSMVEQPSLVAHYGRLLAEAEYEVDLAKQKLEIAESKAAHQLRDDAAEEGKKISEAQITSTLPTVETVVRARMNLNKAKVEFGAMKAAFEALRHKKDMMVQIGVNRRTEIEGKINGLIRADKLDKTKQSDAELRAEAKKLKVA